MTAHIVITEGLVSEDNTPEETHFLSDYFEAVLQRIIQDVPSTEAVFISPGNAFGCAFSEEEYAAQYLGSKRPELNVKYPIKVRDRPYLDTFDNARLLRKWLEQEKLWPLEEVILYCNAPHHLRSQAMFELCEFKVKQVIKCRPQKVQRKMVSRLWFYNYPVVQTIYEIIALCYDFSRWLVWKVNRLRLHQNNLK
ncbi:MAG: hypothetical protein KA714_00785 [Limnoraphis sp. WC205]|jgi:hypothetical protein|nr:hypothetical protein [Limnoraphis sp. WC205]